MTHNVYHIYECISVLWPIVTVLWIEQRGQKWDRAVTSTPLSQHWPIIKFLKTDSQEYEKNLLIHEIFSILRLFLRYIKQAYELSQMCQNIVTVPHTAVPPRTMKSSQSAHGRPKRVPSSGVTIYSSKQNALGQEDHLFVQGGEESAYCYLGQRQKNL